METRAQGLLERLRSEVLVFDGAMGTMLFQAGLTPGDCPELWNAERPDVLQSVHRAYIEAGSDVIETNSFGGTRLKLKAYGLEDRCRELNEKAARLARSVMPAGGFVAGGTGPAEAAEMATAYPAILAAGGRIVGACCGSTPAHIPGHCRRGEAKGMEGVMGLKLAITGKGGVGKSTLAGTLARLMAVDGRRVLAIDADPDANLASALGLPEALRRTVRTISEERHLIEERTGARPREFGQVFRLNPDVTGIAEQYGTHFRGTDLLVLGAAQKAGGGCACPEGVLLKSLVRHLILQRDEVVILDMEAGIEHLGRGTAMGVDLILAVVEPGQRSIETAHRIHSMAAALGIRRFATVLNKASADEDRGWVEKEFGADRVLGVIPFDPRIAEADRRGACLADLGPEDLLRPFRGIQQALQALRPEDEGGLR